MLRPVIRGQYLLDVVQLDGGWRLELELPDRHAAHVLAQPLQAERLPVRYRFRTDPAQEYAAPLSSIGERVELNARGEPIVRCLADLPPGAATPRRSGAAVVARIPCGRRPRAYIWFRELWEYAYRKWWL
jgi:hypothetical protein